jgi:hypothetical protein
MTLNTISLFGILIVFAPFLIIIFIITSPRLLSGDVLLFYVSFSLLLLRHPERSRVTYCYSTFLFHYYYYSSTYFCRFMKGIQNYFKSPLFYFHGNCGKVCPTDSDSFGLSRSTICGCCSYQVSSISVRRVFTSNFTKFCSNVSCHIHI